MKEYKDKPIPNGASQEEIQRIELENNVGELTTIGENLDEIRAIFKVQLDKPGHAKRKTLAEEIIKYLYQNRMDYYKKTGECESGDVFYARTIYKLARILRAVNENDVGALKSAMKDLPWGESNTGDQISWNNVRFAFSIMSDEDRQKFYEIFYYYISKSNMCYGLDHKEVKRKIEAMSSLNYLDELKDYNAEEKAKTDAIKQKQPGSGEE